MKPIVVRMDQASISTDENTVIGTEALGPCVGVLIYSKKHKKSVVFHTSTNWQPIVVETLIILLENNLINKETFGKILMNLQLHEKYELYSFDHKTKQEILAKQNLRLDSGEELEVIIIPGYYKDHYDIANNMKKFFSSLEPLFVLRREELPKKAVRTRMFGDIGSHEFFFDSETGQFVTEKIKDNIDIKGYRI